MKRIIIIAIFFITVSASYSQNSDSITLSQNNEQYSDAQINIKANYLGLAYLHSQNQSGSGYGLITEIQTNLSAGTSLLIAFNPVISKKGKLSLGYYTTIVTAGVKLYFTKKQNVTRGYFSIGPGIAIGGDPSFLVASVLGIDYKINKGIGLNLEFKPIISKVSMISIGAGINFNVN